MISGTAQLLAHGFSVRKRPMLRRFLQRTDIRFLRAGDVIPPGATLLLWGAAPPPIGAPAGVRVVRVEDGFLRSAGLGADLVPAVSWVFDPEGIHFDPRSPSALESMLQAGGFSASELARAAALRRRIVEAGLTKYNLGAPAWRAPPGHREVVLVAGQVETDAAIAAGAVDIRTNLGLLQAVRRARPGAWLVYKPHPDVAAGLRSRGIGEHRAAEACDEVLAHGSMHQLMDQVHEIHVLTSLAGFEALLRGRPVVCWGQPFYAGWGLTRDAHAHPRRTRRLTLDELVAGALLRYPRYVHPHAGRRCEPEEAVEALAQWRDRSRPWHGWWRPLLRPLLARP